MFRSRIAAAMLIVVSVLNNCDKSGCQPQPEQLLETLTTMQTSSTSAEKTVLDLEQRCNGYERIIRTFLPADQQAAASKDELYAHVMSQAERKQSLSEQEERVLGDIRECIGLNSNSMTVTAPVATPASNSGPDAGTHGSDQQTRAQPPMFDQEGIYLLSKLNYESRRETKAERCRLFEETLRSIYSRIRPELASASTPMVYQAAIEGLESRNPPALSLLKECAQSPQASQAASSTSNASQQQQMLSEIAQLRQAQEQLIEQYASSIEQMRQLESNLARETSRAMEKEREIDEFQRRVTTKAGRKALSKLRSEFESFKQGISGLMTDYVNVRSEISTGQRRIVPLIYKRVDEFRSVMAKQLGKVSDNIDALQAKQERANQQYAAIKEGFSKLKSELEKFRQSLANLLSEFSNLSNFEKVRLFYQPLEQFHALLKGQLDTALSIFADDTRPVRRIQKRDVETENYQTQAQPQNLDIYSKLAQLEKTLEQSMEQHAKDRELLRRLENNSENVARRSGTSQNQEQLEPQHLNILSELAQLRQAHERLVEQQASGSETSRRLESDLARETSRATEKEREIDEFQRTIIRNKGKKALGELGTKFETLKMDISNSMAAFSRTNDMTIHQNDRAAQRRDQQNRINKQVDEFKNVMRKQLAKFLGNADTLKGKQGQEDQQYVTIKAGFSKLEPELEKFKQSLVQPFVHSLKSPRADLAQVTKAGLEGFYKTLWKQLHAALEYVGNQESCK